MGDPHFAISTEPIRVHNARSPMTYDFIRHHPLLSRSFTLNPSALSTHPSITTAAATATAVSTVAVTIPSKHHPHLSDSSLTSDNQ